MIAQPSIIDLGQRKLNRDATYSKYLGQFIIIPQKLVIIQHKQTTTPTNNDDFFISKLL